MWSPPRSPGRVVLLNGASSSGKSTIAGELLTILPTPWFHLGVDDIGAMRSAKRTAEVDDPDLPELLARTRAGFHRAVAGLAAAGNDVVADHVLSEPWRLMDCLRVLSAVEVTFVGVRCDAEELERRERVRGDRQVGTGAGQLHSVHSHKHYDVVVDTTRTDARVCAHEIADVVNSEVRPRAFDELRWSLPVD